MAEQVLTEIPFEDAEQLAAKFGAAIPAGTRYIVAARAAALLLHRLLVLCEIPEMMGQYHPADNGEGSEDEARPNHS